MTDRSATATRRRRRSPYRRMARAGALGFNYEEARAIVRPELLELAETKRLQEIERAKLATAIKGASL